MSIFARGTVLSVAVAGRPGIWRILAFSSGAFGRGSSQGVNSVALCAIKAACSSSRRRNFLSKKTSSFTGQSSSPIVRRVSKSKGNAGNEAALEN